MVPWDPELPGERLGKLSRGLKPNLPPPLTSAAQRRFFFLVSEVVKSEDCRAATQLVLAWALKLWP